MDTDIIERAQQFVWANARLVDRKLFACLFLNESGRGVMQALKAYQNPDGGFGNALEPDKRTPHSQPVDVETALHFLDIAGILKDPVLREQALDELVLPACAFLESITTSEGGVPFTLPSTNAYPHAPWWGTEEPLPASPNPTASIAGMLLKHGVEHTWLPGAADFCWKTIEASSSTQYHDLMPMIAFLEHAADRERAARALEQIAGRILRPGVVEYNPQAAGYVKYPLDWAPVPTSFCYTLFDPATITRDLERLKASQQPDGSWPINWDPISPAVALEWRGHLTVMALHTLRAYTGD